MMETLVLAQHRNQCYRSKSQISDRFGASPFRGFRDINCRTFQSGAGILPSPYSLPSPSATRKASVSFPQTSHSAASFDKNDEHLKISTKRNAISIMTKPFVNGSPFNDELSCSELWAGPTYSNSPPPSSLPIPKFSLRQKRSVSLKLQAPDSEITIHSVAESAPTSPTRESSSSASNIFLSTASATENLRRILHLDVSDD